METHDFIITRFTSFAHTQAGISVWLSDVGFLRARFDVIWDKEKNDYDIIGGVSMPESWQVYKLRRMASWFDLVAVIVNSRTPLETWITHEIVDGEAVPAKVKQ